MATNNLAPEDEQSITKSFTETLLKDVKRNQNALVVAMVNAAKSGDIPLLREIIKQVSLLENKATEEENFKLTDEQFKQVIAVAARRLQALHNGSTATRLVIPV